MATSQDLCLRLRDMYPEYQIQYCHGVETDPRHPLLKGFKTRGPDTDRIFIIILTYKTYGPRGVNILISADGIELNNGVTTILIPYTTDWENITLQTISNNIAECTKIKVQDHNIVEQ